MENKTIMSALKSVFIASKDNGFKIKNATAKKALALLTKKLGFSNESIIFLACTIGLDNDDEMTGMRDLASYLGITKMDILEQSGDINILDDRGYIVNNNYNQVAVTSTALDDLMRNRPYEKLDTTLWPADVVLKELRTSVRRNSCDQFHHWEVVMHGNQFIAKIDEIANQLTDESLDIMLGDYSKRIMRNILLYFAGNYSFGSCDEDIAVGSDDIFDCMFYRLSSMKESIFERISFERNPFMRSGYFEYLCEDGIADTERLIPTERFVKELGLKRIKKREQGL